MRVLFVTEELAGGGSERVISVLANRFAVTDEAAVVAIRRDQVKYTLHEKVKYFPFRDENGGKIKRTVGRVLFLRGAIRQYKPDIVVAFDVVPVVYASLACRLCGVKLVVSERVDPQRHESIGYLGKLYFRAFEKCNGAVFQTEDAQKYFSPNVQKKSTVIPNPINEEFAVDRYSGERAKEIVTACRLTKQKNLKLFIDIVSEIISRHPEYKGIIYGDGPEYEELKKYAGSKANGGITFAGRVNNIKDRIYKSHFYLCTSDYEGISNSMLEAMALGLNVVCTDCPVGGARLAITSGVDGVLFPIGDKDAGVRAIDSLIADKEKSENMGKAATNICERWNAAHIADEWRVFLQHVIADH